MTKELVPFHVEHAIAICSVLSDVTRPEIPQLVILQKQGLAFTFMVAGRPLAFGGITILFPGVAEGWAYIDKETWRHTKSFHKLVLHQIALLRLEHGLHRIQVAVRWTFQPGMRWAKHLGFEQEGLMKQYGTNKEDHWRYARIF